MQREEMELLSVRATLWRMEIEILREIHRYRFAKRGRRFGSDVELMIVYGAAIAHYGFGTPVRALPISRYLEMPRETVRRHMGRLVALGLFEREKDQTFVPTTELREVEIERALIVPTRMGSWPVIVTPPTPPSTSSQTCFVVRLHHAQPTAY